MGRKVNVTLYYELFLNDEDESAYKAVDKECDPDLILFWSKLCREHGVIVGCNDVQLPPMTYADHIRAMSDEEMAAELLEWFACFMAVEWSRDMILNWLKEEAKGDTDESD